MDHLTQPPTSAETNRIRRPVRHSVRQTVCVAIATYNRERVLVDTIKQVLAQDPPADEVLVIDQTQEHGPDTESYLAEADRAGRIRWLKQDVPNLPAARNRALWETRCDVILFIDDDVMLTPGFVWQHQKNYRDRGVTAVAGRTLQPRGFPYPNRQPPWPRLMDYHCLPLNKTERVEGIASFAGGNHSVRTAFLRNIGGYDENYLGYAYREDSDAAIRIWKAGGMIVFDPLAELEHLAVPSGGCRFRQQGKLLPEWLIVLPASYFAWRHFFPWPEFWRQIAWSNVRMYVFRRDNVLRPWRVPWAACSYVYSCGLAAWLCMRKARARPQSAAEQDMVYRRNGRPATSLKNSASGRSSAHATR